MVGIRTLRKCKWNEIEIGEVFAYDGCWSIAYKKTRNSCILLDCNYDYFRWEEDIGKTFIIKKGIGKTFIIKKGCVGGYGGQDFSFVKGNKSSYALSPLSGYNNTNDYFYKLSVEVQNLWRTE